MPLKLGSIDISRLRLGNLYNTYLGLTSREQTIALIAVGVLLVLAIALPVTVASDRIGRLEDDIQRGNTQLKDVLREIDVYQELRAELVAAEKKLEGGFDSSIATTMESLASRANIADRIDSLKERPTTASDILDEVTVDVSMRRVSLGDLVTYLQSMEQNPDKILRLRRLEIRPRFDNKKELDVSFSVSTYRLLETTEGG